MPFDKLSRSSQLMHFRYTANDRNYTDARILSRFVDSVLCNAFSRMDSSMFTLIVLQNGSSTTYFYNPQRSLLLELLSNGTIRSSFASPLEIDALPLPLPALDFGSSLIYAGNLSSLSLISRKQHLPSLPLGSLAEVQHRMHRIPLTRHTRQLCYSLFLEAANEAPVRSDQVFSHTIPYLSPSALFKDEDAIAARLLYRTDNFTFYSPFPQLLESLNSSNWMHVAAPSRRTITCRIDTALFQENPYYRQRMENRTWVDGVLLRLHSVEEEGNATVYEVQKEAVRELRYVIDVKEEKEEATLLLALPMETTRQLMQGKCGAIGAEGNKMENEEESSDETPSTVSETPSSSTDIPSNSSETPSSSTDIPSNSSETPSSSTDIPSNSTQSESSSRRLSEDWLLQFILSHRESIVPFSLSLLSLAGLHQLPHPRTASFIAQHHFSLRSAPFPHASSALRRISRLSRLHQHDSPQSFRQCGAIRPRSHASSHQQSRSREDRIANRASFFENNVSPIPFQRRSPVRLYVLLLHSTVRAGEGGPVLRFVMGPVSRYGP